MNDAEYCFMCIPHLNLSFLIMTASIFVLDLIPSFYCPDFPFHTESLFVRQVEAE